MFDVMAWKDFKQSLDYLEQPPELFEENPKLHMYTHKVCKVLLNEIVNLIDRVKQHFYYHFETI